MWTKIASTSQNSCNTRLLLEKHFDQRDGLLTWRIWPTPYLCISTSLPSQYIYLQPLISLYQQHSVQKKKATVIIIFFNIHMCSTIYTRSRAHFTCSHSLYLKGHCSHQYWACLLQTWPSSSTTTYPVCAIKHTLQSIRAGTRRHDIKWLLGHNNL